jgi:CRISPR system Cascade subunit CasD
MTGRRGALLRLGGPLQSWGTHSAFAERDTEPFPTRSGLLGLFSCALGRDRTTLPEDLAPLSVTVRIDRPGQQVVDFHTVGGGLPAKATVPTPAGEHRGEGGGTIVSRRRYLADAVFTIALRGPGPLVARVAGALAEPVWAPYLGRRACPPDGVLLVAADIADPVGRLRTQVPLARPRPPHGQPVVQVRFVHEATVGLPETSQAATELWDLPVSFERLDRRYDRRTVRITTESLPAELCAGYGAEQLRALHTFAASLQDGGRG